MLDLQYMVLIILFSSLIAMRVYFLLTNLVESPFRGKDSDVPIESSTATPRHFSPLQFDSDVDALPLPAESGKGNLWIY